MTGISRPRPRVPATRSSDTKSGIALGSIIAAVISIHAVMNTTDLAASPAPCVWMPCEEWIPGALPHRYIASTLSSEIAAMASSDGGSFCVARASSLMVDAVKSASPALRQNRRMLVGEAPAHSAAAAQIGFQLMRRKRDPKPPAFADFRGRSEHLAQGPLAQGDGPSECALGGRSVHADA